MDSMENVWIDIIIYYEIQFFFNLYQRFYVSTLYYRICVPVFHWSTDYLQA